MHVQLDEAVGLEDRQAVAGAGEVGPQLAGREGAGIGGDDLGAVAEVHGLGGDVGLGREAVRGAVLVGDRLAEHGAAQAVEEEDEAERAGVDDPGAAQHGQEPRGAGDGVPAGGDGPRERVADRGGRGGGGAQALAHEAHGGEHGALAGVRERGGGVVGPGLEGVGEAGGVDGVGARIDASVRGMEFGEVAEEAVEEGGDQEAGVAAALGEQARAQAVGEGGEGIGGALADEAGAQGVDHVRAGVAVGDGEHVEGVEQVGVALELGEAAVQGGEQSTGVEGGGGLAVHGDPVSRIAVEIEVSIA